MDCIILALELFSGIAAGVFGPTSASFSRFAVRTIAEFGAGNDAGIDPSTIQTEIAIELGL